MLTPNVSLTIFGLVNSKLYAIPYIVLIGIVSIVALVLLVRFPSLRKPSRKRSITFYVVVGLVLMLLVFQADNVTRRALVSYQVESDVKFYPETAKQLNLTCRNQGDKSCSFYIVISSVNASFSVQTQPTYVQVNSTTVKVPFTLSERWLFMSDATEHLPFNIDENVTGFSFRILPEFGGGTDLVFIMGDASVNYIWNGTENCYMSGERTAFIV